ncbi:MAG TPA: secretin N-terminal domain-containing protein [Pyrinomonadaceae bacterium]|jgi:general secretion pathway protein D
MKNTAYVRFSIVLLLMISMLSPTAALAGDGKKFFKEGMKAEVAEQWDKAVEQFALAVAENPKNPEYRLHYQRAIFNASQMYMKKGNLLANEKDYQGAYIAYRKAYAYDPVNELAKAQMDKMVRLQKGSENGENPEEKKNDTTDVKLVKTSYGTNVPQDVTVPQKLEKLRDVPFPSGVDLQFIIKELAKDLDLNVLFDSASFRQDRKIKIELKNVTAAKALDYIFLQENLFFQKVGPRTIVVADGGQRQRFQQLVLRTFYLANADPKDVQKVLQAAIPMQPGRAQTVSIVDEDTNSITIRDTEENVRLMGKLISSLDKDRAEVVMDVAIYEVSKSDLLKLGNQIGSEAGLTNLGGTTSGVVGIGGNDRFGTIGRTAANVIPSAFGVGVVIPAVNLVAFQNRQNTRLLASTQIHAFNNEDSSARIGQRVPVRTATITNGFNQGQGGGNNGGFLSDVINYEQVGLDLKFKPIVFPNQDVQVAMEIISKDVAACNTSSGNPCFSERTIKGTARVQNNKTLLLASVAQDRQSDGRQGLPLLGLIPIIGRLFTAPTKDNNQVDIVIAVTPRVIRAPAILPEDEIERPTGSLAVPTTGSLEAMVIQEEREELLAAARRLPTVAQVQLPDQKAEEAPTYVKSNSSQTASQTTSGAESQSSIQMPSAEATAQNTGLPLSSIRPIDTSTKTLQINQTADKAQANPAANFQETALKTSANAASEMPPVNAPQAEVQILSGLSEMKKGEKTKVAVMVKSATAFRSAVLGLRFDDKKLAVRSVSFGDVYGNGLTNTTATPFINQSGKMFVSLSSAKDSAQNASGILAYIEIEALADGKHELSFDKDVMNILTADGKNFAIKF